MAEIILPDEWQILRVLGRSPLSEVYLIQNQQQEKRALKLLRPSVAKDHRVLERWRREAQLLSEIQHPNLVGSFGNMDLGDRPGLLLEYIEGPTLRDRLRVGYLEWEQVSRIGVQVARALEKLHANGAIHRDVKPHNIILHPKRGAVLADLGLVKRSDDPELTRQGAALGSPAYMSPEQAIDPSSTGPESDIFSLAATLHHALSGRPAFLGKGIGEVIHRVLHESAEDLPETVPEGLCAVIDLAMEKNPEHRYQRAFDFRNDLARILTGSSPKLISRQQRRSRIRKVVMGIALAVVVPALLFLPDLKSPLIPQVETQSDDSSSNLTSKDEVLALDASVADPVFDMSAWSKSQLGAFNLALQGQDWTEAKIQLAQLQKVEVPASASQEDFQTWWSALVEANAGFSLALQQKRLQALEILANQKDVFLRQVVAGKVDSSISNWKEDVISLWDSRGLSKLVLDLCSPPHPYKLLDTDVEELKLIQIQSVAAKEVRTSEQVHPVLEDAGSTTDSGNDVPTSNIDLEEHGPIIQNEMEGNAVAVEPKNDAAALLSQQWKSLFPEAQIIQDRQVVEIRWIEPEFGGRKGWKRELSVDKRKWKIIEWGMEWELSREEDIPRHLQLMSEIEFLQASPKSIPRLQVAASEHLGLGIVAGARQSIVWRDGAIIFDGLRLGEWEMKSTARINLSAHAITTFSPRYLWAKVSIKD